MLDFSKIKESSPSSFVAGEHKVRFGKWEFLENNKGNLYLQIAFDKDGVEKKDGLPFCSCRLYFSSEKAISISKGYLHQICNKMGIEYSEERLANDETILKIGEELLGREIDIILKPTGGKSDKGYDYLGVHIPDVGDLFIKYNPEYVPDVQALTEIASEKDDIPF